MTKIKDQLSREKAVKNVYMMLESIFEASSKIEESVTNYPDTWVVSLNKNLASFLVYITGIEEKYIKEIKPTIKKWLILFPLQKIFYNYHFISFIGTG